MSRRNWRIIFAAIGLATLGGASYELFQSSEQQQSNYIYQPARHSRVQVIFPAKIKAKAYEPDCENPQGKEDADLCAQWAAVDQVMESNRMASVNVRLALFIAILSLIGTSFVVWTFMETRATARRELRAYLFPERVGIYPILNQKGGRTAEIGASISIKNSGSTPAYKVHHWGALDMVEFSREKEMRVDPTLPHLVTNPVPPGGEIHKNLRGLRLKLSEIRLLKKGTLIIYVYGRIDYEDAFGVKQFTHYRFAWSSWPIPTNVMMKFAIEGNEAT